MNFLRNAWYVAALSESVTTIPIKRVVLGEPIAVYRTEAGVPVALSDRCPHRFAPLHQGKVKGDCIECPYHGLQFNPAGACVVNPHGDHKIPQAAKVKRFALEERDGMVWIWTGDASQADKSKLLDLGEFFGHGAMAPVSGDYILNAHYELVLDNLLDLSHAPFLHPTTLADPESIKTLRVEMKQEGDAVWAYHYFPGSPPAPQFKPFRQSANLLCDGHAHMRWDPPGSLRLDVGVTECGSPAEEGLFIHMVHMLTPIDMHQTRYTWIAARNFLTDVQAVSQGMQQQIDQAFTTEDEPMIQWVAANMGTHDLFSWSPVLLPGDAAGVRARRILKQLREQETRPTVT
jgi:phenylpropionate dioxygenase-like ring-hydroxylating dioxygenase large terminal subunit